MPTYQLAHGHGDDLDVIEVRCDAELTAADLVAAYPSLRWFAERRLEHRVDGQAVQVTVVCASSEMLLTAPDQFNVRCAELLCRSNAVVGQRTLSDEAALDAMAYLFAAEEWPGASGLEDLCEIVTSTGRDVSDDPDVEWRRH